MTTPATPPIHLRVPATSANLGPGFDTLGLAMSLYLEVWAQQGSAFSIEATGRDQEICGSLSNNLILMTYTEVLGAMGAAAPPLNLRLVNGIPLGMGCGSSAAAIVAGTMLASHYGELSWSATQILDAAAQREGHPDNVAACVLGGITAAAPNGDHTAAIRFAAQVPCRWLIALPKQSLSTAEARAVLPKSYSRADAVANVQASSLLVAALCAGRADLLAVAMRDRLHQPFREAISPLYRQLKELHHREGVYGIALSGAGPAVLLATDYGFPLKSVEAMAGAHLAELIEVEIVEGALSGL